MEPLTAAHLTALVLVFLTAVLVAQLCHARAAAQALTGFWVIAPDSPNRRRYARYELAIAPPKNGQRLLHANIALEAGEAADALVGLVSRAWVAELGTAFRFDVSNAPEHFPLPKTLVVSVDAPRGRLQLRAPSGETLASLMRDNAASSALDAPAGAPATQKDADDI